VEVGGFTYTDGGEGDFSVEVPGVGDVPIGAIRKGFEGYDYANLGNRGVAGNDVIAWSLGFRVPISEHAIFGAAYEDNLSERKDLLGRRASVNLTLEF
jgi:hypothetical protein